VSRESRESRERAEREQRERERESRESRESRERAEREQREQRERESVCLTLPWLEKEAVDSTERSTSVSAVSESIKTGNLKTTCSEHKKQWRVCLQEAREREEEKSSGVCLSV
jgi:hypothetical protein